MQAVKTYDELENVYKAKAFIQIYNYADEPLAANKNYIDWGLTSQLPDIIDRGYKDAITLYQNVPTRGLEGLISYALPDNYRVYVFVKVGQKLIFRKENQLGICITQNTGGDSWDSEDWYEKMIGDNSPCLNIHKKFATSPRTLQCCRGNYCIQATMTSSNHGNVTVRILPISVSDLGVDLSHNPEEFSQDDLNFILNVEDSCNSPGHRNTVRPQTTTTTTTTPEPTMRYMSSRTKAGDTGYVAVGSSRENRMTYGPRNTATRGARTLCLFQLFMSVSCLVFVFR